MTNYAVKDVDAYISAAAKEARPHLEAVRAAVRSAVREAEEAIKWGKPFYAHHGMLAGFDALKNHISFEIWADELRSSDRKALEDKGYKTGKRTFQIRYDQKVPSALIKSMVKALARENEAKE
jgi:uncharacterized protein YdhG (YjbR/CyaY superfamily)